MSLVRAFSFLLAFFLIAASVRASGRLVVFAPSSMTEVMGEITQAYEKKSGQSIALSLAATSQLARQLDAGASVDFFITADKRWMDWVDERKLLDSKSIRVLAGNRLVVAARREVENWADVKALVTEARFAMAEPEAVPAGRYARQALEHMGLWKAAKSKAVYSENVRITLRRLALGEVGAAIVYATDVAVEPDVKILFSFPPESHDPIQYWAAVPVRGSGADVQRFFDFMRGPEVATLFKKHSFLPPHPTAPDGQ